MFKKKNAGKAADAAPVTAASLANSSPANGNLASDLTNSSYANSSPANSGGNPPRPVRKRKKKRAAKIIKRIIGLLILFAVIAAVGYYVYTLFHKPKPVSQALHEPVHRGSIQSMVTGSGITKAQNSSAVTLTAGGNVQSVFVTEGQTVNEGDPLYLIDSKDAQTAVSTAQEDVDKINKKISDIHDYYDKLKIKVPFSGKLINAADISKGAVVSTGTKIGTVVDDSIMKLTLYFSYGYEKNISVGQAAQVSIPSAMETLSGKVTEIHKVQRISTEGTKLFEAVIEVKNPGTLTEGMTASAALDDGNGGYIYPYESAVLKYIKSQDILAEAQGNVLSVSLINYSMVDAGDVLVTLDSDIYDEQLNALDTQLETANETLKKAQDTLKNYQATAPMTGTVISVGITVGQAATAGTVAVNIADTSTMIVEAQVDEINISYVKQGMTCDITQWGRNGEMHYMGVVDYVSLKADTSSGASYFPAKITVQNQDGSLMTGMNVEYSMVAAQSDDCLIAPVQAVKYTNSGACVFVMADKAPDNALDASSLGLDVPAGYYPVPVQIGLSDDNGVEIISGVDEGTEVFTQYMENSANSMGGGAVMMG